MSLLEETLADRIKNRVAVGLTKLLRMLALKLTRFIIIILSLILIGILSNAQVWQPLNQETSLPPGVTRANPELSIDLLQGINAQRVERVQSSRHQFSVSRLFSGSIISTR